MIKIDVNDAVKEINRAMKQRNIDKAKMDLAIKLARIETLAKHTNNQVALDLVKNIKENLKFLSKL